MNPILLYLKHSFMASRYNREAFFKSTEIDINLLILISTKVLEIPRKKPHSFKGHVTQAWCT